eukprot:3048238-Lingulodinium_polyedra.AAC.1
MRSTAEARHAEIVGRLKDELMTALTEVETKNSELGRVKQDLQYYSTHLSNTQAQVRRCNESTLTYRRHVAAAQAAQDKAEQKLASVEEAMAEERQRFSDELVAARSGPSSSSATAGAGASWIKEQQRLIQMFNTAIEKS